MSHDSDTWDAYCKANGIKCQGCDKHIPYSQKAYFNDGGMCSSCYINVYGELDD